MSDSSVSQKKNTDKDQNEDCIWTLHVKWTRTNVSVPVRTDKYMLVSDFKSLAQARYREHNDCRFGGEVPVLIFRGTSICDHSTIAECGAQNNDTLFAISVKPRTTTATGTNNTGANFVSPNSGTNSSLSTSTQEAQHDSRASGIVPSSVQVDYPNSSTASTDARDSTSNNVTGTNNNETGTCTNNILSTDNSSSNNPPLTNALHPIVPHSRNNIQALANLPDGNNSSSTVPVPTPYSSEGFYPSTGSNNANPLFSGMFDTGMLGGMSQDTVQQMMQSPFVQNLMDRPEFVSMVLDSNPALRELRERNPELNHILNDPQLLRESMEAVRNPNIFRETMRSNDRAMSNIEAMPGGFNALRRMYHTVQEPVWEAAVAGMSSQDSTGTSAGIPRIDSDTLDPNCSALPNPWSPNRGTSVNNDNINNNAFRQPTQQAQRPAQPQSESNSEPANPSTDKRTEQQDEDEDDDLYG
eukprot:Lankesteria_metandrocarpae@DN2813_c0_g1_i1.p1